MRIICLLIGEVRHPDFPHEPLQGRASFGPFLAVHLNPNREFIPFPPHISSLEGNEKAGADFKKGDLGGGGEKAGTGQGLADG